MAYSWKSGVLTGISIPENSDAPFATLAAKDGEVEAFSYSLGGGHRGLFEIDAYGVLSLKNALDYESSSSNRIRFPSDKMFTVEVRAHSDDGARVQERTFVLTLGNEDDFDGEWHNGRGYNANGRNLNENNEAGYQVAEFRARDKDSDSNIVYNALEGTDAAYFRLEDRGDGRARLYLKSTLDFEDTSHADGLYSVIIKADPSDDSGPITRLYVLTLKDSNDKIEWDTGGNPTSNSVSENLAIGTSLADFGATDDETGASVTYSIRGRHRDDSYFQIDKDTGVLSVKKEFDYENKAHYTVVVRAQSDDDGNRLEQTFVLTVADVDDATTWRDGGYRGGRYNQDGRDINENNSIGSEVARFRATDGEKNVDIDYSLSGGDAAYFSIDSRGGGGEGRLYLKSRLDFEDSNHTSQIYSVIVNAQESGADASTAITQLYVLTLNDRDEGAQWDMNGNPTGNTISENLVVGTSLADFGATDPESAGATAVTYSLLTGRSGRDYKYFEIDPATGVLTTKSTFDFESKEHYTVVVRARAITGEDDRAEQTFVLTVTDIENTADFSAGGNGLTISENNTVGFSASNRIDDFGNDDAGATITYGVSGRDADYFSIRDEAGWLFVKSTFDFENPDNATNRYSVIITANANVEGTAVTKLFILTIANVDDLDNSPTTWRDGGYRGGRYNQDGREFNENNNEGSEVARFRASDGDKNVDITYSLTGADEAYFSIDSRGGGGEGRLYLKSTLDFEAKEFYSVLITATSTDSGTDDAVTQLFILSLQDRDDKTEWNIINNGASELETIAVGENVGTAFSAIDEDAGATVTYGIRGRHRDDSYFNIDENSGQLTVKKEFDYEKKERYTVEVRAGETGEGSGFSVAQTFVLTVVNVANEFEGQWRDGGYRGGRYNPDGRNINENNNAGSEIARFRATDADKDSNIVYNALEGDQAAYFSLESRGGGEARLYLKSSLDYETQTHYSVIVKADPSDASGPISQLYILTLSDRDDANWATNGTSNGITISENADIGVTLANFSAIDDDGGTVAYDITGSDAKYFNINKDDGNLTTKSDLNFEDKELYTVVVRARAGGSGDRAEQTFVLTIGDANDSPEWVRQKQPLNSGRDRKDETPDGEQNVTIKEAVDGNTSDAFAGRQVAKYKAIDDDADNDATVQITYSLTGDDTEYFSIDSNGRLFLASNLDFEDTNHTSPIYNVIIHATSTAGDNTTANAISNLFVLTLQDKDDKSEWDTNGNPSGATISKFGNFDSVLANFKAIDEDLTASGQTITYGIRGNHRDHSYFQIDKDTGALKLKKELPDDPKDYYTVVVRAGETGEGSGFSVAQEFVLTITDTNNTPDFIAGNNNAGKTISENNSSEVSFANQVADFNNAAPTVGVLTYGLSGDNANYFDIGLLNGRLFPKVSFDFESDYGQSIDNRYSVIVVASADVEGGAKTRLFILTVTDVNEGPEWRDGKYNRNRDDYNPGGENLNENNSIGSEVARFRAADPEGNADVTYSLTGTDEAYFSIDSRSGDEGRLYAVSSLDFEAKEYYSVVVVATSTDDSPNAISQTFILSLNNRNDEDTTWQSGGNPTGNTLSENLAIGTSIADFGATDLDGATVTYSIRGRHRDHSYFDIDKDSGVLSVKKIFDFENKDHYTVEVRARSLDGSASVNETFVLTITDVNSTRGWASGTPSGITLSENLPIGTEVYNINALNPAAGGGSITFGISGDDADYFNIGQSNGVITFASVLDFENPANDNNLYSVIIHSNATIDGTEITRLFVLTITDVDNTTAFSAGGTGATISENNVVAFAAGDRIDDFGNDGATVSITYGVSGDHADYFSIAATTGWLFVTSSFDYENPANDDNRYSVLIIANADVEGDEISQLFILTVANLDNSFQWIANPASYGDNGIIDENNTPPTALATFEANDLEAGDILDSYSLATATTDKDFFSINADGVLFAVSAFDHEHASHDNSYHVRIIAHATDGTTVTQDFRITVANENEFDTNWTMGGNPTGNTLAENNTIGTSLADFGATDLDGVTVTYRLAGADDDYFAIDAATGVLTANSSFNFETKDHYTVEVRARSIDGSASIDQDFVLTITDVNEAPEWRAGSYNSGSNDYNESGRTQNENNSIGNEVARFRATDGDKVEVTYSLSGTDEAYFSIDSRDGSQGRLYTASSLDFETQEYYSVVVVATSTDDSPTAISQLFILSVTDRNEPAEWTQTQNGTSLAENTRSVNLGNFAAADPEGATVTYGIRENHKDSEYFQINATTGLMSMTKAIDFEARTATGTGADARSLYTVVVRANSVDGNDSDRLEHTYVLSIRDVAEETVWVETGNGNTLNKSKTIAENNDAGVLVDVFSARDGDNGTTISYQLLVDGIPDSAYFSINADTGQLYALSSFDFEDPNHIDNNGNVDNTYAIFILAYSSDTTNTINARFDLTISNVNEFATTWTDGVAPSGAELAENNAVNAVVAGFITADADNPNNDNTNTQSYWLTGADADSFHVTKNASAGNLRVSESFDFETKDRYTVVVNARDTTGSGTGGVAALHVSSTFVLTITDAADQSFWAESGKSSILNKSSTIAENNDVGSLLTTFSARDQDSGTTISYTLHDAAVAGDAKYFSINSDTGQIYALSSFDFEDPTRNGDNSYRVLIQAHPSDVTTAILGYFNLTITNDTSDDGSGGFLPLDPTPDQPVGLNGKILFDGDTDNLGGISDGIGNDGLIIIGDDLSVTQYDSVSATNTDLVLNNIENFEQSFVGFTDADGNTQNHWFFVRDDAGDNTGHIVFDADGLDVNLDSLNNGGATTTPDQINLLAGLNFGNDGDFNKPDDLDLDLNNNQAASLTHDQFLALIGGSNNIDFI